MNIAIQIIEESTTDEEIYLKLRNIYQNNNKELWSEWGKSVLDISVTGRSISRIKEIEGYLPKRPKFYLDVGGGNGEIAFGIASHLHLKKRYVFVIDVGEFYSPLLTKYLSFGICKRDDSIPLFSNSVDLITAFQTLHHIRDLKFKLKEIYRILSPGGKFIIREHNCENEHVASLIDVEHILYDVVLLGRDYQKTFNEYYGEYLSKFEWTNFLKKVGFKFIRYLPVSNTHNPTKYYYGVYTK